MPSMPKGASRLPSLRKRIKVTRYSALVPNVLPRETILPSVWIATALSALPAVPSFVSSGAPLLKDASNWPSASTRAIQAGEHDFLQLQAQAKATFAAAGLRADYVEIRNANDLQPARREDRQLVILAAAFVGNTRLIDNLAFDLDTTA